MGKNSTDAQAGLFYQEPQPGDTQHPVFVFRRLGFQMMMHRKVVREMGREPYGKYLAQYTGRSISRGTIAAAEAGEITVGMDVYFAYLYDMGWMETFVEGLEWAELLRPLDVVARAHEKAKGPKAWHSPTGRGA